MPIAGGYIEPVAGLERALHGQGSFGFVGQVLGSGFDQRPGVDRVFTETVLLGSLRLQDENVFDIVMPSKTLDAAGCAKEMHIDRRLEGLSKFCGQQRKSRMKPLG